MSSILSPGRASASPTSSPSLLRKLMAMLLRIPFSQGSEESPSGGGVPKSSFERAFLNASNSPILSCGRVLK